jgi:hypothetical protein
MNTTPADTSGKNRRWIVFFLVLAMLAAVGIFVPWWFNLSLQLKAEDLAKAKELWRDHGPADYDLEYAFKIDNDEPWRYRVAVRSRQVTWVHGPLGVYTAAELRDAIGQAVGPLWLISTFLTPARELTMGHSIDAFLTMMENTQRNDAAEGSRNYARATFDATDGHPLQYVHRDRATGERVELNVRLLAPGQP